MLFLLFALILLISPIQSETTGKSNFCPYKRIIVATRDNVLPPGTQVDFRDENFTVTQSFGCGRLYGSDWPAFVKTQARDWFFYLTGIDYTLGTPGNDLSWTTPGVGTMFPFVYGFDYSYRIQSDRENCKETKGKNNWFIFNTGYLVTLLGNGTFPGGTLAGRTWSNLQILSYDEYNFLNEDEQDRWGTLDDRWRQKVLVRSRQPGYNLRNVARGFDQAFYAELVDLRNQDKGLLSFVVSYTNTSLWVPGGPAIQSTRNIMTFGQVQTYPSPYPASEPCPAPVNA